MTYEDLVAQYQAAHQEALARCKMHLAAKEAYTTAAADPRTTAEAAARLRADMDAAGNEFSKWFTYAESLKQKVVAGANEATIAAATEYIKRKSFKSEPVALRWASVDWVPITDFVLPVAAVAGAYHLSGMYLAAPVAAFAALTTAVRVLWRQRTETRSRYELLQNNASSNERWVNEAADRLNQLVGTKLAAGTLAKDLAARHAVLTMQQAHNQIAYRAAEAVRAARRQAGLDAWRDRQSTAAVATAAAVVGGTAAVAYGAAGEVDQALPAALDPIEPLPYYDMPTMEPIDPYPEYNTNGAPMVYGTGVDVHGDTYAAPTWP